MRDLKERVVRGGAARIGAQAAHFLIRMGTLIVFARLLDPMDFGIVGMVTAVTGIFNVFKDFGLSTATVQSETLTNDQSSTLFWLNLIVGAALCGLTSISAPLLVRFYGEPVLLPVTLALASGFLINAAGIQHSAHLQRQMRFVALAAIQVVALLVSSAFGIAMAAAQLGYWALVAWSLLLPTVNTIGVWIAAAWTPGRPNRGVGIGSMIKFGTTYTVNGVVIYVAYNLDKVLVGHFWGSSALGLYGRAYQLVNLAADSVIEAIGGVAFSALSRVRNDDQLLRSYFLKGYKIVLTLIVPVTILLALFAEEIVFILLGPKWEGAVTILRLLTPTLLAFAMINPAGWLLLSVGLIGRSLKIALVIAPLVVTGSVIGLSYGAEGVALGFSVAMTLWIVPHILWSMKGTAIAASDVFRTMIKPCVSGIVAGIVTFGFRWFIGAALPSFLSLAFGGAILVSVYFAVLLLVMGERSFYFDLITTLKGRGTANRTGE